MFLLHFLVGLIILAIVIVHIGILHTKGSTDTDTKNNRVY